jgi:hypothetical protein
LPPLDPPLHVRLRTLLDARKGELMDVEIAERAGMDKTFLYRLVTGRIADPHVSTLRALLHAVGATPADLDWS